MSEIFKDKEEMEEYLANLGIEYRYSCYSEKNPEGCHLLGDFLQLVRGDFKKAVQVYKFNCASYRYFKSCNKLGVFTFQGKGMKANIKESTKLFKIACEEGSAEGCHHYGQMMCGDDEQVVQAGVKPNFPAAFEALEKGCQLGSPDSCFDASAVRLTGLGGEGKDDKKAFEFARRGCNEFLHFESCNNLLLMYDREIGTKKDEKKMAETQEKINDHLRAMNKHEELGLQQGT